MKVFRGLDTLDPPIEGAVLTVGNFDGVHRAHQQLLAQAGLYAADTGGPVVVLTFEPHPLEVVAQKKAPPRLSPLEEKLRCLAAGGADVVVIARSEPALLALPPERFVEEVIVRRFRPTHIVEGPSFGFGRGREGTPELLCALGPKLGFLVHIVEPVHLEVEKDHPVLISSSLVRRLLAEGKVHRAALCLGRPYALIGEVVEGCRRGRTLGYPTANVAVSEQLIPADGVYSAWAVLEDGAGGTLRSPAAVSIGRTPTFAGSGEPPRQVEAHLLDFDGDLYGQWLRVELDRPIREQRRFENADALVAQLDRDVQEVRRLLAPADGDCGHHGGA